MAEIKPITGLRYNKEKVGDLTEVITPPYDVIDPAAQKKFYAINPYNVIRLELGEKYPEDDHENNVYTRAAATFVKWCLDEVLIKEPEPALYLYQQEFQALGEAKVRTGFLCGLKAEDYAKGQVLPHEETLPKHKEDRLKLMRATEANFSPIFGLYSDPERLIDQALLDSIQQKKPNIEITDWAKEVHRVWGITDKNIINTVVKAMEKKKVFIADGHHRYETAVAYGKEMKQQGGRNFDYILINLVNLYDPGLVILPTHRLIRNVSGFDLGRFLGQLKEDFELKPIPPADSRETTLEQLLKEMEERGRRNHTFGLYAQENFYLVSLKKETVIDQTVGPNKSPAWRHLDVTILHTLIMENILGIGAAERASEGFLKYTRDNLDAVESVDRGEFQLALLMNPTKIDEVTAVAEAGEKMPQKSTFFYPKVISGLVINKLGEKSC